MRTLKRLSLPTLIAAALLAFNPLMPEAPVVSKDTQAKAMLQYFGYPLYLCWSDCAEGLCCKKIIVDPF